MRGFTTEQLLLALVLGLIVGGVALCRLFFTACQPG
jgi:hypothetical protein